MGVVSSAFRIYFSRCSRTTTHYYYSRTVRASTYCNDGTLEVALVLFYYQTYRPKRLLCNHNGGIVLGSGQVRSSASTGNVTLTLCVAADT